MEKSKNKYRTWISEKKQNGRYVGVRESATKE